MPVPATFNLTGELAIYKGDTYTLPLRLKDTTLNAYINLTGHQVKSQIRTKPGGTNTLLATFVATVPDQSVGANVGKVTLTLDGNITRDIPAGTHAWDVQLRYPDNTIRTLLAGTVTVQDEVTLDDGVP